MRRKIIIVSLAAVLLPVTVFGLPLVFVICVGPVRANAAVMWLNRVAMKRHEHPVGKLVPSFAMLDQDERSLTGDSLKGHVWIASFFLSRCAGACPMTSAKMARLQREVANPDVKLVSFSMDPQRDTPQVLRDYAAKFDADSKRWHMLTGEREQIMAVVNDLGLAEQEGLELKDMIHSDKFVLVDKTGHARGFYDSSKEQDMQHLATDATALEERP